MDYIGMTKDDLKSRGGFFTGSEIAGQPQLWHKVSALIDSKQDEIQKFLAHSLVDAKKIILTGAGTSAYIGLSLQGVFQRKLKTCTDAVATTDLVSHPQDYFSGDTTVLLVSFARSGNSPESIAAVKLADKFSQKCYHLIVTCDKDGALAKFETKSPHFVLLLPPESNDKGLAMTGSYTSMLLAGMLIARIQELDIVQPQIAIICKYGEKVINEYSDALQKIAETNFNRGVFLGSGPFFGTATESHLKLQELTDGMIICKNETFLGFRHGPKAVVNEHTMIEYIFSNEKYVMKYEKDLVKAMTKGRKPMVEFAISEIEIPGLKLDLFIQLSNNGKQVDEELLSICYVIPGQLIGFFKSLHMGFKPDAPSKSGSIARVVEGVNIYDML